MNKEIPPKQYQNKDEAENTQGVTLFSLIVSISIGSFTLLKSFFDNIMALIISMVFIVVLVFAIRIAASHGVLRGIGRWLSGN